MEAVEAVEAERFAQIFRSLTGGDLWPATCSLSIVRREVVAAGGRPHRARDGWRYSFTTPDGVVHPVNCPREAARLAGFIVQSRVILSEREEQVLSQAASDGDVVRVSCGDEGVRGRVATSLDGVMCVCDACVEVGEGVGQFFSFPDFVTHSGRPRSRKGEIRWRAIIEMTPVDGGEPWTLRDRAFRKRRRRRADPPCAPPAPDLPVEAGDVATEPATVQAGGLDGAAAEGDDEGAPMDAPAVDGGYTAVLEQEQVADAAPLMLPPPRLPRLPPLSDTVALFAAPDRDLSCVRIVREIASVAARVTGGDVDSLVRVRAALGRMSGQQLAIAHDALWSACDVDDVPLATALVADLLQQ